jgi:hypothetical protein
MVLAQKQIGRPMDQNRRSRIEDPEDVHQRSSTANWSSTMVLKTHNEEKTASSTNATGKTIYPHAEDWN